MAKLADLARIQRLWTKIKNTFVAKGSDGAVEISNKLTVEHTIIANDGIKSSGTIDVMDGDYVCIYDTDNRNCATLSSDRDGALLLDGERVATQTYVNAAVANAGHLKREKVTTLPGVSTASENVIYMVPATDGSGNDVFDEYMKIENKLEKIGSNRVDLSGYSTTEQMNTAISTAVSNSYTLITDAEIDALT